MNNVAFEQFVGPARAYPQIWRLVLGIFLALFIYLGCVAIMAVAIYPIVGPINYFSWMSGLMTADTPGHVFFVLLSFAGMAIGAMVAAAACHYRGPSTLFGPARRFIPDFVRTLIFVGPLYVILGIYSVSAMELETNHLLRSWLMLLPIALPLVFLQVTAEELIFRGYLPQQLAARFKAKWVWMVLPSLLFAILHFDPRAGLAAYSMVATILLFAMIAMDLSARRGNLGAAIALHLVNNCFALLFVSVKGTITGLSLFITPYSIENASQLGRSALLDVALLFLVWKLLKGVLRD